MVWVSGVTPYLDDVELSEFFADEKATLKRGALLIVRELGSERQTVRADREINRTPRELIKVAASAGCRCLSFRRSYPVFFLNKLANLWPNGLTRSLWRVASARLAWPLWERVARLNIPRGGRKCFFAYCFDVAEP